MLFIRFRSSLIAALAVLCTWAAHAAAPADDPQAMTARVAACTACHGKDGRATPGGYFPRIAGKPAGYLYHQLVNFRDGRRQYRPMTHLLDHLSDDYLREIADHFASLEVPYPPPATPGLAAAVLAQGRALVLKGDAARDVPACVRCHGEAMTGVAPAIPGLLGLPRDYLNAQLGAWKTGQRHAAAPDCMAKLTDKLTSTDITAVAAWLAAQPVPVPSKAVARSALAQPLPMDCGGVQ
ncbi:c-type cytochrome [Sphaerotilus sp.]|uniref:c-type cytochrome n=1 Tax=Sphaerotilus sp. TaxID=2093942 RepID=UPI0025CBC42B|nr:c-type cytochrome [Sphaerotilus sp.]